MNSELLTSLAIAATIAAPSQDSISEKLASLEERYRGSLVQVRYTQQVQVSTAEPARQEELTTTGIIVSTEGVVMVSAVVFEPFNQVPHGIGIRFPASVSRTEAEIREARVRVDGREYSATLLGRDSDADLAFFRIESEGESFQPVVFSADRAATVGQQVVVLSRLPDPLGPNLAVELSRVQSLLTKPQDGFLVGTGAADPVGSLVCDLDGNPLGMLDALMVPMPQANMRNPYSVLSVLRGLPKGVGRGFARPASHLAAAAAEPPKASSARRGWLGVEMQALTPELSSHLELPADKGIIIGFVYRASPAEEAGLVTGDILVELEGRPIEVSHDDDMGAFAEKLLRSGAGARLTLGYLRDGERSETVATLAPAPKTRREAETIEVEELDLIVREVTYDYLAFRNLEPGKKGIVVQKPPVAVRTNPNRVIRGDLLVKLNEREVSNLGSFREVVEELRSEKPEEVVLFIERGRESFFFAIKPEWE
jgi:serine protease Do